MFNDDSPSGIAGQASASVGDALDRISSILEELVNSLKVLEQRVSDLEDRPQAGETP